MRKEFRLVLEKIYEQLGGHVDFHFYDSSYCCRSIEEVELFLKDPYALVARYRGITKAEAIALDPERFLLE